MNCERRKRKRTMGGFRPEMGAPPRHFIRPRMEKLLGSFLKTNVIDHCNATIKASGVPTCGNIHCVSELRFEFTGTGVQFLREAFAIFADIRVRGEIKYSQFHSNQANSMSWHTLSTYKKGMTKFVITL